MKVYGRLSRKLVLDSTATAKKIVSSKKRQREECSQLCDVLRQSGRLDCCKLEVAATANARPPTCCRLRAVSDEVAGRKLGERAAEFVVWRSLSMTLASSVILAASLRDVPLARVLGDYRSVSTTWAVRKRFVRDSV